MQKYLLIALGGALGSIARYWVGSAIGSRMGIEVSLRHLCYQYDRLHDRWLLRHISQQARRVEPGMAVF